jgi:2-keto-4-pentenoate hydratase
LSLDQQDLHAWADRIYQAHQSGQLLQPISDQVHLSLDDAYDIQALLTERRLAAGAARIGWKLGYTSEAMRHQMGVTAPNLGPLLSSMLLISGPVPSTFTQPRVEPEIALRMATDLRPQCSFSEAAVAVGAAYAALEIVDSVWVDYQFTLPDNTADGSSAAAVVLGPELALTDDLGSVEVDFFRNAARLVRQG